MNVMSAARGRQILSAAVAAVLCVSTALAAPKGRPGYEHYLVGNPADAASAHPPTTPSAMLMGGGTDVDAAFQWMIARAGGGDFVVIRASGTDAYNPYIYAMGGVDSVETLIVKTRDAASDPVVVDKVAKAEALFIAGGDQSDYVKLWKGTPLAAAINGLIARKVPVGGTSAGLAILGANLYSALYGTVESADALANPYTRRVTLDRDFLAVPGLAGTIADPHFHARDRMGRLLTFVARTVQDGWTPVAQARGIGVDEETALLIDNGIATRVGTGSVYLLKPSIAPTVCQSRKPLTFRNVAVQRMSGGGSFNLGSWASPDAATQAYDLSVEAGVLTSSQAGGAVY